MDIIQSPLKRRIISLTKKKHIDVWCIARATMNGYIHNIALILICSFRTTGSMLFRPWNSAWTRLFISGEGGACSKLQRMECYPLRLKPPLDGKGGIESLVASGLGRGGFSNVLHSTPCLVPHDNTELCYNNTLISRSVLTRAELDALPLDNNVKEEVERGKVRIIRETFLTVSRGFWNLWLFCFPICFLVGLCLFKSELSVSTGARSKIPGVAWLTVPSNDSPCCSENAFNWLILIYLYDNTRRNISSIAIAHSSPPTCYLPLYH